MMALERQQKEARTNLKAESKEMWQSLHAGSAEVSTDTQWGLGDSPGTARSPWSAGEPQVLSSGGWESCDNPGSFHYIWKIEVEIYFLFFFSNDIESTWGPTSLFKKYFSFVCAALLTFLGFYNIMGFRGSGILPMHTASCCKTRGVFRKGLLWQLRPVEWLELIKIIATGDSNTWSNTVTTFKEKEKNQTLPHSPLPPKRKKKKKI